MSVAAPSLQLPSLQIRAAVLGINLFLLFLVCGKEGWIPPFLRPFSSVINMWQYVWYEMTRTFYLGKYDKLANYVSLLPTSGRGEPWLNYPHKLVLLDWIFHSGDSLCSWWGRVNTWPFRELVFNKGGVFQSVAHSALLQIRSLRVTLR